MDAFRIRFCWKSLPMQESEPKLFYDKNRKRRAPNAERSLPCQALERFSIFLAGLFDYFQWEVRRGRRYDGRSKMSFVALTGHGLRSIAVFAETVLTRIVIAAFLLAALGGLILVIVFAMKLLGIASPGWTTTVAGVILIVVAQIAMTGLLGLFVILRGQRPDPLDAAPAAQGLIDRIDRFGRE